MPSNKQKRATSKEDMDTTTDNVDAESVDSQSQNQNKAKRLRSSSSTPTPTKLQQQQTLTKQSQKQVQNYIQDLLDIIRSYRTDSPSKCPSETFTRLPSKRSHAQYYTQIQQPIDLTQIQQKITNATYTNVDEFEADFTLLITNAKTFYKSAKATSVEYKDAQCLWDLFEMEKKKRIDIMMSLLDQDEAKTTTTTTTSDQELETTPTKRS